MPVARNAAAEDDPPAPARATKALPGDAEWLLTDGRGGFGCGAVDRLPRRRYHGLWVARPDGAARRAMLVADLDERVRPLDCGDDASMARLLHARWRTDDAPTAPAGSERFARRPLPTWCFETARGDFERTVALRPAADSAPPLLLVRWVNRSDTSLRLEVRPLLGWCDADHLIAADESFRGAVSARGASWGFRPTDALPPLWLTVDGVAAFRAEPAWYRGVTFEVDRVRGYDHEGDRWSPGLLELDLAPGAEAVAAFALSEPHVGAREAFAAVLAAERARCAGVAAAQYPEAARLELGADDFLYRGVGERLGVLAGFPWFGEWGRDVFVSLPGLTLSRGRGDLCAQVLTGCLPFLDRGLLPNIYSVDVDESHYGSCDAALWFALAVARFADSGGDPALVSERLVPALRSIAAAYERGAGLGLRVDEGGLLQAGREDLNATWMDARTSQGPVTPRQGLAVELQALWYSLLAFLAEQGDPDGVYAARRDRCGEAFVAAFWLADDGYLADRVLDGAVDRSLRPNMLVAAALPRSPLDRAQRRSVVEQARAHLVTPFGLRTLGPEDPAYLGVYGGGLEGRDLAYHQGTVWPWLAGFFVEASLRAAAPADRAEVAQQRLEWLTALLGSELDRAGLEHVSEVFDGDPPHRPGGTFAQAWNTGELLRAHRLCTAALRGAGEVLV